MSFFVAENVYAVAIEAVREIVAPLPLTELPHSSPSIPGVADHRGDVVTVVDLRARFGAPPAPSELRLKWIVVDVAGRPVALVVDRVAEVFAVSSDDLMPPPDVAHGEEQRGILGVVSRHQRLVFVLDLGRVRALADAARQEAER